MEFLEIGRQTILRIEEHKGFSVDELTVDGLGDVLKKAIENSVATQSLPELRLMGMDYVFRDREFCMSYYIGADWIDSKKQQAIEVLPKIRNIDFQRMLMKCFEHDEAGENLEELFFIRAEDRPICLPSKDFQLEPLVIIYFLNLVADIARKGLRKNFVGREERLNGKIKGKIMMSLYAKHGFAQGRKDRVDCKFEEYDVNCLENKILKKALLITDSMLKRTQKVWGKGMMEKVQQLLNFSLPAFEGVSADVHPRDLLHLKSSPMFSNYLPALKMARTIIQKQGIGISQETEDGYTMVPPFIINMPLLFERYVYALLFDRYGRSIQFQKGTKADRPDFLKLDEHMILDAKYKAMWENGVDTENVRQLSGYARNVSIRKMLGVSDESFVCPCTIIYPSIDGITDFSAFPTELSASTDPRWQFIPRYQRFYKIGVNLPVVN